LVTVTVWAKLVTFNGELNVSAVGETVLTGALPVPLSRTVCGLVGSPSLMDNVAVRAPVTVGLNRTVIAQLLPAARLVPQVVVLVKSPGFAPVMVMPVMDKAAAPLFNRVTN
jgi:hypothetical protein